MIIHCLYCGKEKKTYPCKIKMGKGKYCNKICYGKSQIGKEISKETRRKMSQKMIGNTRGFKKGHAINLGKKRSMPAWNKGIPMKEEMKQLMSIMRKGKHYSPSTEWKKGQYHPPTEIKIGQHLNPEGEFKKGGNLAEDHPRWKGDDISYTGIHHWIESRLGKAQECVYCGRDRLDSKIEWASISHKAKRDLNDYISLCSRCHHKYDNIAKKVWEIRRSNKIFEQYCCFH